ncbi:MAG: uroporphyrinogen decarboxylase family protein [Leptospiraceae bacterium]|nr:uroporphyrinogen decarboxylase family protein [Leptospiraceae bacterium]
MKSMERVLTSLSFIEPDRVPLFLLFTMHGAKELKISIQEYFSKSESVVEGQLLLRQKYEHDCYYSFYYAAIETEAFGGEVIYQEDGPPNAGKPIFTKESVKNVKIPNVKETACLVKVLNCIQGLKQYSKSEVPIIGVVMSPFSLPVMQLGFENYLELLHYDTEIFWELMRLNMEFCVEWANAQIEAGANAICYFDPISSPTIIPINQYLNTGWKIAKETIAKIGGLVAVHFASGISNPIIENTIMSGASIVGVSFLDSLEDIKILSYQKASILGNLDGIKMASWTEDEAEENVKRTIQKVGEGGGFILSDNHGEIPYQVPNFVLQKISDSVKKWGRYPLQIN